MKIEDFRPHEGNNSCANSEVVDLFFGALLDVFVRQVAISGHNRNYGKNFLTTYNRKRAIRNLRFS